MRALNDSPWKTRIAAPKQTGFSRWHGDEAARRAVTNNRARLKSGVAREAFKLRAEIVERCFAHNLDRGGMRRTWLRGRENVHKRYLLHVAGHNLSLLMRQLIGAGTPREAVAGGYGGIFVLLTPTGAMLVARGGSQSGQTAFAAAFLIWEFCRKKPLNQRAVKPDGGLKDMMARVTMLAMHRDGLIVLPPPRGRQHRPKPVVFGPDTEPPLLPAPTTLDEVRPIDLRPVVRETREGRLWNEFVARYHYLGYKTLVGAQMRYAVHDRNGWPIAMLGFSTAAWKLAPRDNFIGWTPRSREKNLPLVVDNPRFLILPWITIPNLGSHILALIRRRLPLDWAERYNTTPVLIETFVETPRYTGAVYRASGWLHVGATQGRGRYDRDKLYDKPRKDIWLRPLRKDWKRALNR